MKSNYEGQRVFVLQGRIHRSCIVDHVQAVGCPFEHDR
jgi:hypothetical protein